MVCKEELCKWFKNLRPHQRIDYMCGLLHMCLPLELRFLGSVLEDHGKKNYNFLRDAELKANNSVEISKLYSGTDKQVRATVSVYLSLLHSSNTPCAQLLYEVLEKNLERAFTFGTDPNDNEEIWMALTLAINHPAFQFHQKNILYEHYARSNPEVTDRRNKNTEAFDLYEEAPLLVNSPTVDDRLRERLECIGNIELKDVRKQSGKKFELKIHVTWSNGDVYEVCKTMRDMLDLHMKLKELFPEEGDLQKREWKSAFQSHSYHSYGHSHKEDQLRNMANYFSLLLRLPATLKHEQVMEFFKGGNLVQQGSQEPVVPPPPRITCVPLTPMSVNTGEEQGIPPFPLKSLTVCNSQLHPFPQNYMVSSDPNLRLPRCNSSDYLPPPNPQRHVCPHGVGPQHVESPSHSPPSSTTESPLNSRSASPSHNSDTVCMETIQLLQLLNLEQYADTLGKLTFKQLKSQTPEDLSKAGLPREAQHKLRSKLETINREKSVPSVNGLVDGSSSGGTLSPASPNNIPWVHPAPFFLAQHPYSGIFIAQHSPSPVPPVQPEVVDTSPHDSEVSSAPPSPTQMCIQKAKTDSSGSEDNDRDKSNCGEHDKPRTDNRRKIYQNRTILQQRPPQYPHSHHLADEMKGGMVRQPSPHNLSEMPQTGGTMPSYNGYQSDPNPSPVTSANFPRPPYYPAQIIRPMKPSPAHTNISLHNKNIINMPQEGHIKQPMMMYYPGSIRTDIPMTTSVMPMNLNNNTVTNQTYSANNEGMNSSQRLPPYMSTVMSRPIVLSGPRSVPANLNNVSTVTVSQGGSQPMAGGHSPGPANISVKPTNGVPLPIPNPCGTPPESIHSGGSDSPLQMLHSQSTGSTTVTFSTATSTFSGSQTAVSTANSHTQCSSCGCNCNSGSTSSSPSYQPQQYNAIPYPLFMTAPGLMNGMMPLHYGHHVPPPNYPNGINHEMYVNSHPGLQHFHQAMAPHLVHSMYGNLHHSQGGNPGAHVKHKPHSCYNCGSSQHKAQDCKETSMDGISGNYHLNYKPKSDSD